MSGNQLGQIFRVMTFGESHGPYTGLVIDGLRPGMPINIDLIQRELGRRKPGQSKLTTSRQEHDQVQIVSGILNGTTTGTPLCMLIPNQDQRPLDYRDLEEILRPGHAGFTFLTKYGIFDFRGGGRASGRETATRVAAGAVAKQFLKERGIEIIGYTHRIGMIRIESIDYSVIEKNRVRAPDLQAGKKMEEAILLAQKEGDSLGGIVEIVVKNCPAGLGEPVFNKLEACLAGSLMSIGAVKGVEIGSGFHSAAQKGSEHNNSYYLDKEDQRIRTKSNHSGGILGGISNGEDLVMRIAVKPPSSIRKVQQTVDRGGKPVKLEMGGRHDPCICPRIVPVAEAMVALVLIDHILLQERISAEEGLEDLTKKIDTMNTQIILLLGQRKKLLRKYESLDLVNRSEDRTWVENTEKKWEHMAKILGLTDDEVNKILHF